MDFLQRTMADDFDAAQALGILQHRYTMDYSQRSSGSKPASTADEYYPVFYLDMISIVGQPLLSIIHRSSFFDNVTFTLHRWQAPYSSKHAVSSLPFELAHRTFRLATGASRENWFVVMHPVRAEALELRTKRERGGGSGGRSAMRRHHAEVLAGYIKGVFLDGALLGEGVEPLWTLGGQQSQNISFEKWSVFQTKFMQGWPGFMEVYRYDGFWKDHQPAFHAYDHGANLEIQVNQALQSLAREVRLRSDEDGSESGSSNDEEEESEESDRNEHHSVLWTRDGSDGSGTRSRSREQAEGPSRGPSRQPNRELYTSETATDRAWAKLRLEPHHAGVVRDRGHIPSLTEYFLVNTYLSFVVICIVAALDVSAAPSPAQSSPGPVQVHLFVFGGGRITKLSTHRMLRWRIPAYHTNISQMRTFSVSKL